MTTQLLAYGQVLKTTLAVTTNQLQSHLDGLLKVEDVPVDQPQKSGFPVWVIVLIVIGVVVCLLPICIIALLTLLGPSIGNVFSNIIDSI